MATLLNSLKVFVRAFFKKLVGFGENPQFSSQVGGFKGADPLNLLKVFVRAFFKKLVGVWGRSSRNLPLFNWGILRGLAPLTIFLTFALQGCYVLKLAYEQTALLVSRDDIDVLLVAEDTPAKLKKKLQLITEILAFAQKEGLKVEDAYSHYVAVERDAISYVVFAAHATRLELVQWWYPVVGELPYRGYFSIEEREVKAAELAEQGFDVARSDVDAYSSLGWFSDPIYSTMLTRRRSSLAHLLFHELVHRTYWLKDASAFNESIAEFVADRMTAAWLRGRGEPQEIEYRQHYWVDRRKYLRWLGDLKKALQEVYAQKENVLEKKAAVFKRFLANKPDFQAVDFIGKREWNNARVAVAKMYNFELEKFKKVYACLDAQEKFNDAADFLSYLDKNLTAVEPLENFYKLCS